MGVPGLEVDLLPWTRALEEFIGRREQTRLLELFGALDWDSDYDYKSERERR